MAKIVDSLKEKVGSIDTEKIKDAAVKAGEKVSKGAKDLKDKTIEVKDDIKDKLTELDRELEQSITNYNDAYTILEDNGVSLFMQRTRAVDVVENVEKLVNSIANKPKTFDVEFDEIEMHKKNFKGACDFAKEELTNARMSSSVAGAGLAAGTAVASMAPTAAMWVATTFGTASTGTAIASLSGAAAQSAALAWLGGGALTAGGGGMAAGNALLALAGPVGWGIAGASVLASVVLFSASKSKTNKKKNEEIMSIKDNTTKVKIMSDKLDAILNETVLLRDKLADSYDECMDLFKKDYTSFGNDEKTRLANLVNNTKSLSMLFDKGLE